MSPHLQIFIITSLLLYSYIKHIANLVWLRVQSWSTFGWCKSLAQAPKCCKSAGRHFCATDVHWPPCVAPHHRVQAKLCWLFLASAGLGKGKERWRGGERGNLGWWRALLGAGRWGVEIRALTGSHASSKLPFLGSREQSLVASICSVLGYIQRWSKSK